MTTTTFKINNTCNTTTCPFHNANYSTILDNIIASNIIKNNEYLKKAKEDAFIDNLLGKKSTTIFSSLLKGDDEFTKAANFLANYKKKTSKKLPFIFGKIYKLIDGTPICFYYDEIQIDTELYSYDDFSNISFLNKLEEPKKNIIINIFNASNSNIKINLF